MEEDEIKKAIESKHICRIAFIEDDYPYISPFQYVYLDGQLYFHFTDYGKKKKILMNNNNVCISIEHFADDLSQYFFISMQGKLLLVEDSVEKEHVLKKMVENAKNEFSPNFLSAHGFNKAKGWNAFKFKNQIIYKFEEIGKTTALKSI
jgi:nitroimidazol reductase NimA-like FMN-containing flavoprotein (pyridoxamine 5'-phosphate oxidase superfamily)